MEYIIAVSIFVIAMILMLRKVINEDSKRHAERMEMKRNYFISELKIRKHEEEKAANYWNRYKVDEPKKELAE